MGGCTIGGKGMNDKHNICTVCSDIVLASKLLLVRHSCVGLHPRLSCK